jgi:type I restriction enzyme, S subunit
VTHPQSDWLSSIGGTLPRLALGYRYEVQLGKMLDEKQVTGNHLRPYLRNVDVQWGRVNTSNLPQMDFDDAERHKFTLKSGDILVCEGGEVGRAAVWESAPDLEEVYFQKALHRLRPLQPHDEHPRYMYWCLHAAAAQNAYADGGKSTIAHLPADSFRRVRFPKPGHYEQERIANFLDKQTARIDALIADKDQLLERLSEYLYSQSSSLMTQGVRAGVKLRQTSFPELGEIPAHWDVKRLKFLGEVRSGVAKGKDLGEKVTVSLPYLRVANVQDGYVDLTEVNYIEVAESEAERYLLRKGDVLMNEGGDNDKLGRGTVWEGQIDPCIHQNHVFAVRLDVPAQAEWVARFTSTDAARSYFFLRSKQSTNLASINQSNVRELPVPMPPEAERKAILENVRSLASRC